MTTAPVDSPSEALFRSFLALRRAVGAIGISLPLALILGKLIVDGGGLQDSISGYYHTGMRDVYVGAMCACGVVLLAYRGYDRIDHIAGNIAGIAAIGVGVLPTSPDGADRTDRIVGAVHVGLAAVFFLTLAFFCLFLFTRTDKAQITVRKVWRNRVYVASGVTILACLALIVVLGYFLDAHTSSWYPTLWLESLAVMAFGVAWLTKGEAILADIPDLVP